jgi:hypothetical protein
MKTNNTFKKVAAIKIIKIQDIQNTPFEGVYLGSKQGKFGLNYFFLKDGGYVQILGSKDLHQKLILAQRGNLIKLTFLQTIESKNGHLFHEVLVEEAESSLPEQDLSQHLRMFSN